MTRFLELLLAATWVGDARPLDCPQTVPTAFFLKPVETALKYWVLSSSSVSKKHDRHP